MPDRVRPVHVILNLTSTFTINFSFRLNISTVLLFSKVVVTTCSRTPPVSRHLSSTLHLGRLCYLNQPILWFASGMQPEIENLEAPASIPGHLDAKAMTLVVMIVLALLYTVITVSPSSNETIRTTEV
jgi:hypothetical protein